MGVNELKKEWVVSTSGRRLQGNKISLLRKGLNVAITPHTLPTKDILASVEATICHLARENEDATRAEVYGALKHAKPPKQRNLTNEERRALKELKSDENIIIIRADKGNCTVVMERTVYRNQIQSPIKGAIQHQERSFSCRENFWVGRKLGTLMKQSTAAPPLRLHTTIVLRFT